MTTFQLARGPLPLYYQLQEHLSDRIRTGEFTVGDTLPTEEQLCAAYGVSRITVRRALDSLLNAGLISRRRGVGTFVAEPRPSVKSLTLVGSLSELFVNAKDLSYRVLSRTVVEPTGWVQKALDVGPGGRVFRLELINLSGLSPFAYSEFFFDEAVGQKIGTDELERSIPILVLAEDKAGERITRALQTIEPALVDDVTAKHLGVPPGAAVLKVLRTYFTASDRPVQAQVMRCHPEHYRYTVTLFGGAERPERSAPGHARA